MTLKILKGKSRRAEEISKKENSKERNEDEETRAKNWEGLARGREGRRR
jgi:hypothetical protein